MEAIISAYGVVLKNKNFIAANGKEFTKEYMQKLICDYKNVNRLHKPLGLLFYTDVINGKTKNWNCKKTNK
jgi:hypothetical protein